MQESSDEAQGAPEGGEAEAAGGGGDSGGPGGDGARRPAEGAVAEVVGDLLTRLWRRGRVEMEKATRQARERLTLRQLRGDRDRMYQKLGKEARHLLEGGELDHPGIRRAVERIRELEGRIQEQEDRLRAVGLDPATVAEEPEAGEAGDATP